MPEENSRTKRWSDAHEALGSVVIRDADGNVVSGGAASKRDDASGSVAEGGKSPENESEAEPG